MGKKEIFSNRLVKLLIILTGFILLTIIYFQRLPDGKLHLVFCDVGQGDAIMITTPAGEQVLIDGGPDNSVLSCLGKNLPFYDRNLELVILTHPQADHLTGLVSVFENYSVSRVLTTKATNDVSEFKEFLQVLSEEKTQKFEAVADTTINLGDRVLAKIIWPPKNFSLIENQDLNDSSVILRLDFDRFCALLTGDAGNFVWANLAAQGSLKSCFLLKIPHHGSKNATSLQFLEATTPAIGVISAGKNNRYGHPDKEVVKGLREKGIKILRTDELGTIKIITDGNSVQIKK